MAVSIRDVAKAAGVTVGTVSRAFNGYSDIREETKQLILDAAKELGYVPNLNAKRLAGKVAASHDNKLDITTVVKEAYYLYVMDGKKETEDRDELDLREQEGYEELKKKGMVDGMEW